MTTVSPKSTDETQKQMTFTMKLNINTDKFYTLFIHPNSSLNNGLG